MNHRQQWDQRFDTDDFVFGEHPNRFLTEQAYRLPEGARILAVADGEGRNGVWLAEQGHHVVSVDISANGQAKARRLAAARGAQVDFQIADLSDWHWPVAAFDAVVAIFIQFAGADLRRVMFDGMKRAVRPGGLILVQGYSPGQLAHGTGGPRDVENLYTEDMLRAAFDGWSVEHLRSHDDMLDEGAGHRGMSALIDLVVRRPVSAR